MSKSKGKEQKAQAKGGQSGRRKKAAQETPVAAASARTPAKPQKTTKKTKKTPPQKPQAAPKPSVEPKEKPHLSGLSSKHLLFVSEFLLDRNASRAYSDVYGIPPGPVTISAASRLLRKVNIAAEVKRRLSTLLQKCNYDVETVLHKLSLVADGNLGDFIVVQPDGTATLNLSCITHEQMKAVAEYRVETVDVPAGEGVTIPVRKARLKMKDDVGALKVIGAYLKMFSESKQRVTDHMRDVIQQLRNGDITVEEAAYEYAALGEPLPEVIKIKLQALNKIPEDDNYKPFSQEDIDRRRAEMERGIKEQREHFIGERQVQVADVKERLKEAGADAFSPEHFAGEEP